jgi:Cu/Ag efflux pump CusA
MEYYFMDERIAFSISAGVGFIALFGISQRNRID